jgi:hypothetical protein
MYLLEVSMGKYTPLGDYLRAQQRNEVPMTFAQIERVIGGTLPHSHRYRAWWSNNAFNSVMTKVWLDAGFRSADVDIEKRKLVFRKLAPQEPGRVSEDAVGNVERAAVSKRHPMFGALKGLVRIAPGTDLTDPADPDWGRMRET